jgi:hypothetical protein
MQFPTVSGIELLYNYEEAYHSLIQSSFILEVTCESTPNSGNQCVVVIGELTLYEDGNQGQSSTTAVKNKIRQEMNSGTFDSSEEDIVKVSYIELAPLDNAGTTTLQGDNATSPQVSSPIGIRVGLFIGAGIAMAAIYGLAYRQRTKNETDDEETELGTQPPEASEQADTVSPEA